MSVELWVAFIVAAAVVIAIPGPTTLTVISFSVAQGRRANLALVIAVALGDSTALLASILGLGALFAISAFWFTVVKGAGCGYLVYVGVRMLCTGGSAAAISSPIVPGSRWRAFATTYLVTALNPKSIVFFVAFLPQFVDHTAPPAQQLWVLGITFVTMGAVNATLYTAFVVSARERLSSMRAQRRFNVLGGSLLSVAGVWGLFSRRAL